VDLLIAESISYRMRIFWPAIIAVTISILLVGGLVLTGLLDTEDPDRDGDGIPDRIDLFPLDRDNDAIRDGWDFFPDYEGALLITVQEVLLLQEFHGHSSVQVQVRIVVNGDVWGFPGDNLTLDTGEALSVDGSVLVDVPDDLEEGSLSFSIWASHPSNSSLDGALALEPEGIEDNISYIYGSSPSLDVNQSTALPEEYASVQATINFSVQAVPMSEVASLDWQFKGQSYSLNLSIENHLCYYYYAHDIPRYYTDATAVRAFVTPDDPLLVSLADNLSALFHPDWTVAEKAGMVMAMVQYMTYALDNESSGANEYWSFPVETLFVGMGDCEDSTLLLASLYKYYGYECAVLLFFPTEPDIAGHAAVALALDDWEGFYYNHGGIRYYYVETTYPGW